MSTSRPSRSARRFRPAALALPIAGLAAVALSGCADSGGDPGSGGWAGTTRDSAGITIVENTSEGIWTDADRWTLTEELRIGTNEGEPEYQFAAISGIAGLPDGRIAVLDGQAQEFRIFSPDGEHLRTIGRPGSGPGEFGMGAGPVLVAGGDTLLIPDLMNQRLNRYAPDGEPLGSVPMTMGSGMPMLWVDRPAGDVVTQLRPFALPGSDVPTSGNDVLVVRGPDGRIRDTLMTFESGGTLELSRGGGSMEATMFAPEPVWALSGDRIVFGVNDDFRLSVYREDGTVERIFTMPFTAREVTEADQQVFMSLMEALWEDFGLPPEAIEIASQSIHFAEMYPAFARIQGGPDATIWVQELRPLAEMAPGDLSAVAQGTPGSSTWRVFDRDGVFLGELRTPDRFQPFRFDGDRILGVQRDEYDVQYAVVLRVSRGS
jgi:hypothetical protein